MVQSTSSRFAASASMYASIVAIVLALVCPPAALFAQSNIPPPVPDPSATDTSGSGARNLPIRAASGGSTKGAGETLLRVSSFGVGNSARPGDWMGMLVDVTDSTDKPRNVIVRVHVPDSDGDTAYVQRRITPNPGERQSVWIYFRLPASYKGGDVLEITAHLAIDAGTNDKGVAQYRTGRVLGSTSYLIPVQTTSLSPFDSLIGIVGQRWGGLEQYTWMEQPIPGAPPTGHEYTRAIPGLKPASLPDRWMGLSQFESIVWSGPGSDEQPSLLRSEQAEALREWVQRGGHLIVVLPSVGQNWLGGVGSNPLSDIMPVVRVQRAEDVDLDGYRSIFTRERRAAMPKGMVVQSFTPENAGPYEAMPIMTGPKVASEVLVVRRIVGAGAVTLVGIDVASPKFALAPGAIQADVFWNRLLGKRMRTLSQEQLAREQKAGSFSARHLQAEVDGVVGDSISRRGSAAAGVLLALGVFAAYWLLAGPIGFFALRHKQLVQHTWLAFVGAIALFTAIAWGGANLLKIRRVEGQHLTIIDSVFGQSVQRARSWVGLFLPNYGEQRVSVLPGDGSLGVFHQTISAWEPPAGSSAGGSAVFPDARGYEVEARSPSTADYPARATVKQVQVDWAGALPAAWNLPTPSATSQTPLGAEIRLADRQVDDELGVGGLGSGGVGKQAANQRRWKLLGSVRHKLPAALKDVKIILVMEPTPVQLAPMVGPLPMRIVGGGLPTAMNDEWPAGADLVLDQCFSLSPVDPEEFLKRVRGIANSSVVGVISRDNREWRDVLTAFALYPILTPPNPNSPQQDLQLRRQLTHGWDLGRWFTQPCIIILGVMEDVELPVPVSVDGLGADAVQARVKGRVGFRWVYPLPAQPFQTLAPAPADPAISP